MTQKKSLLIITIILVISSSLSAQNINALIDQYGKIEKFKLVDVNKTMLSMTRALADKESRKTLKKISGMRILSADSSVDHQNLINDIKELTNQQNYEKLVKVNEKGETTNLYFKELDKNNTELLIVSNDKSGNLSVVLINGNIKPDEFGKLNKKTDKSK